MDLTEKLAEAGYLSNEQIKAIEERVVAFIKQAQKDPELYAEAQEKLGGLGSFMEGLRGGGGGEGFGRALGKQTLLTSANLLALGTVGGGAALAVDAYKSMRESKAKAKAYKDMMAHAADRLEGIPARQIQQSFSTLHATNPDYAKDPVVAAEFIRETSRSEAYPFQLLKMMGDTKRDRPRSMLEEYKGFMSPMKPEEMFGRSPRPGSENTE